MAIEECYSVKEVAVKLHVSERTVWRWINDRRLTHLRIGGCVRIKQCDLQKLLSNSLVKRLPGRVPPILQMKLKPR